MLGWEAGDLRIEVDGRGNVSALSRKGDGKAVLAPAQASPLLRIVPKEGWRNQLRLLRMERS
ncbi:hypothetical protein [Paenibacillus sp. MBLB4367]|uniref:hypothetical protein n=1 Tax=Paenibacillus sp. MBLB4367 TaxID=3384767 RepID=UPI0039082A90